MANYQAQQSNSYGQYFGYGSGNQYGSSSSQNKWGTGTDSNTGNQTQQASQNQNQQQMYQAAAQNYAAASGFYGNQMYGQQQSYTGSVDNSVNAGGTRNTNPGTGSTTGTISTGNKYSSAASTTTCTTSSTNVTGTSSYSSGFGVNGSFTTNSADKSGMFAQNQMLGGVYGTNQNAGMNSNMASNMAGMNNSLTGNMTGMNSNMTGNMTGMNNMTSSMTGMNSNLTGNMAVPATNQAQSFGSSGTADALGQFNQMSQQLFGAGANYGAYTSGDTSAAAGYNQAFNTGMMTLLQQSLLQQANSGAANSGAAFGMGTGNSWGMSTDGDGGFYAPPADSSYQSGGKKGKKWTGKDSNKQDFYGNRFAHMFTGMPGIMGQGQSQIGGGKGKRLMDGVRINVKGEKVIDVEMPLALYSRWGQLRKFFSKQDTEVAKHLLEFHDEMCEECLEREQGKKKTKQDVVPEPVDAVCAKRSGSEVEEEETELSEEDLMMRQMMGFGKFQTTREAMVEGSQVDSTAASAIVPDTNAKSTASWEAKAGFIGPNKPAKKSSGSEMPDTQPSLRSTVKNDEPAALSEDEKRIMNKLGWSVFSMKKNKNGDESGDDDDDNEEKMDDGGKN